MKTWYVRRGAENVTIYDSFDAAGNGNARFSGTLEGALVELARSMQETDELRTAKKALEEEAARLKAKLGEQ